MGVFKGLGVQEGEEIHHKMLSSAIQKAQEKIEANNYGIRKNLLDYDLVNNEQREIIYRERSQVLDGDNMRDSILKMIYDTVDNTVDRAIGESNDPEEWDIDDLNRQLDAIIPLKPLDAGIVKEVKENKSALKQKLKEEAVKLYEAKEAEFSSEEEIREIERVILLKVIDEKWMMHIDDMEQLRQGIGLVGYGQRDPKVEYKMLAYDMFSEMTNSIQEDTIRVLYHAHPQENVEREQVAEITGTNRDDDSLKKKPVAKAKKVYPNDPCPCGSGLKFKQCHGKPGAPKLDF
jgi:preprotein translocase subunit SecA